MSAFTKSYDNIYKALSSVSALVALVDVETNLYPLNDPGTPGPGPLVVYGWINSFWDAKARRGDGTLVVIAGSEVNKVEASRILDIVRTNLTARSLTAGTVVFALCKEIEGPGDAATSPSGRFEAQASFSCKIVEG